jgi:hypothetical protein
MCEDGKIYDGENSLFRKGDSIWTYNCPCPSGSSGCLTKHVCRFKHKDAGSSLQADSVLARKLAADFQQLLEAFSQRRPVENKAYRPVQTVEEEEEEEKEENQDVSSPYTTYTQFRELREGMKLSLKHKLCRHRHGCNMRDECIFAHTVDEILEPFAYERVRQFYQYEAVIREAAYKPTSYRLQNAANVRCPGLCCKPDHASIQLRLYQPISTYLYYPYLIVRCGNCKRVTNLPVYL